MSDVPAAAWSLTVGPSHLLMEPGHTARLSVTDSGSRPLTVTGSVIRVGETASRTCVPAAGTVTGIRVSPARLTLAPGVTGWVTITVAKDAPAQDVAAVFTASAGKGAGTARVSGAVGSQVVVGHVPGCHIPVPAPAAAPAPAGAGIGGDAGLAGIAAVGLAVVVAAAAWLRKHLRWQA